MRHVGFQAHQIYSGAQTNKKIRISKDVAKKLVRIIKRNIRKKTSVEEKYRIALDSQRGQKSIAILGLSLRELTGTPRLKDLRCDVESDLIGRMVIFKVDRLTRSLAGSSKRIDFLDSKGCSYHVTVVYGWLRLCKVFFKRC